MPDPLESLKLLADSTRLRLIALVQEEELSVAEFQEILDTGQSRISSHLALLRQGGLVQDRKDGKKSFYRLSTSLALAEKAIVNQVLTSVQELSPFRADRSALERILEKRRRKTEQYFNAVAGRLGKQYCPGRSWEAIGHFLLCLTPKIRIADLGAGEGMLSQLLSQRAEKVWAIDNSPKMVQVGKALAEKQGFANLEYRLGDIEDVPLEDESVDLVLLSQALHHARHPQKAIAESWRILAPGGKIAVLDLAEHIFEKARELYADTWLGFPENTLYGMLRDGGFSNVEVNVVSQEESEPRFKTLLGLGHKES